jgi:hypothetical protein
VICLIVECRGEKVGEPVTDVTGPCIPSERDYGDVKEWGMVEPGE